MTPGAHRAFLNAVSAGAPPRASSGLRAGLPPLRQEAGAQPAGHAEQRKEPDTCPHVVEGRQRFPWYREPFLTMGKSTSLVLGQKSSTRQSFLPCLASSLQSVLCSGALIPLSLAWCSGCCHLFPHLPNPVLPSGLPDFPFLPLLYSLFGNPPGPLHCCHLLLVDNFWMSVSVLNSPLNLQLFTAHGTFCPVSPSIK